MRITSLVIHRNVDRHGCQCGDHSEGGGQRKIKAKAYVAVCLCARSCGAQCWVIGGRVRNSATRGELEERGEYISLQLF